MLFAPGRPATPVHAEQWLCLGILNDALRYVILHYALDQRPGVLGEAFVWSRERVGEDRIDRMPSAFVRLFPPRSVLLESYDPDAWYREGEPELSARDRVIAMLERVGLPDASRQYRAYPHELSGGMRKRAGLARARGVTYVNHTFTTHLALSASLQPYAGLAQHRICEYPAHPSALARAVTVNPLQRDMAGEIRAPDAPGLGVDVDTQALRQFLVETEIQVGGKVIYRTPELS